MGGSTTPAKNPAWSPRAVPGSFPNSPRSAMAPIKTSKAPSRTASNLVSPKYGEGPLCHNPVSPKTPKEMTGSAIERSTGIIYPYNMWGPCNPTKHGHLASVPPYLKEKEHYKGKHHKLLQVNHGIASVPRYLKGEEHFKSKHDELEKDRLMKRKFGHIRHNCYYKNLMEPPTTESLAWLDPKRKEFWRTDVERVLKRDEEKRRARQKEILGVWTNEEAWRRHNLQKLRDVKYQEYLDLTKQKAKYGCRANKSGAPHINIITRQPIPCGDAEIAVENFQRGVMEYKKVARTLLLRERSSGARNYNILNWKKNPPGPTLPPWPEKPPPRPPPPPPESN